MKKVLFLVRHAHRDKLMGGLADNGLSKKGKDQAKELKKFFKQNYLEQYKKPYLVSSPRKRCKETLEPLAEHLEMKLHISELLEEGSLLESKIDRFMEWWKVEAPEFTIACSHGDWIPLAIEKTTGKSIDLRKGAWAKLMLSDEKIKLVELGEVD